MKLKVLPLEGWMTFETEEIEECRVKKITPILNRDGYYLRDNTYCWFESDGRAYEYNRKDFQFSLDSYNTRWLRPEEVNAIRVLMRNNLASKELKQMYWNFEHLMNIKTLITETKLFLGRHCG